MDGAGVDVYKPHWIPGAWGWANFQGNRGDLTDLLRTLPAVET
jgi:hypothetical protein